MSENDAQLELKKRARRRLVGAAALAVLAAVVLPMVMDQEPKPVPQDIQIRIPNQDAGSFTSRILPVKPGSVPTPLPPAAAPEAKPQPEAKAEAPAAAKETEPPKPEAPKQEPKKSAPEPVKPTQESRPEKAASRIDGKSELARAEAALNGDAQWIVQIGAYRDPGNVRNLQAKVKEQGYNSYTEPLVTDGIRKTRVRAGPFASREAAEKARERLKRIGVDGVVAQKQ